MTVSVDNTALFTVSELIDALRNRTGDGGFQIRFFAGPRRGQWGKGWIGVVTAADIPELVEQLETYRTAQNGGAFPVRMLAVGNKRAVTYRSGFVASIHPPLVDTVVVGVYCTGL